MNNNYVENRVLKDREFCINLRQGITDFFEKENMVTLFSSDKRLIKAIRNNDKAFIFDNNDGRISVFYDNILPFENEKSLKEVVYLNESELNKNPNRELFLNYIYSEVKIDKDKEEFFSVDKLKLTDRYANIVDKMIENNQARKNLLSEDSEFVFFRSDYIEEKHISYSSGKLKEFCDFLSEKKYMKKYEEKKYIDFSFDFVRGYSNDIDYCFVVSKQIYDFCQKNMCDKNNKYDNYTSQVFFYDDNLIIENDNYCLICDILDEQNYKIYNIKDFSQYESLKKRIENNSVDLSDFSLIVKNGEVYYVDYLIEYMILDLNSISENLAEEEEFDIKFPVDIKDYNYQRQYYQNNYGMNEFQFLTTMFLAPAASDNHHNDYLFDTKITYQKFDIEVPNRNKKETRFNYCYIDHLSKIKRLNDDWISGLEYLIEKLKVDKPKAIAVDYKLATKYGNNHEKCLEKTIEALEKVLTRAIKNKKDKILPGPK